jgi:hypothetical protein
VKVIAANNLKESVPIANEPIAPPIKRKYQKKPKTATSVAEEKQSLLPLPMPIVAVKEEPAVEKPGDDVAPLLDARSARKFRAQIKAGDHYLIHSLSHSLSH